MTQRSGPAFPEALADDGDDVTWALETAHVQWKRGAYSDAIEWLRRAAESAVDSGKAIRARELTQKTNGLEAALKAGLFPPPWAQSPPMKTIPDNEDDGTELLDEDPYGELAVDIDIEPAFELRPSSRIPPRSAHATTSSEELADEDVEEVDEVDPIDEVDEVDEFDDLDAASLASTRAPESGPDEVDLIISGRPPADDDERPTVPPAERAERNARVRTLPLPLPLPLPAPLPNPSTLPRPPAAPRPPLAPRPPTAPHSAGAVRPTQAHAPRASSTTPPARAPIGRVEAKTNAERLPVARVESSVRPPPGRAERALRSTRPMPRTRETGSEAGSESVRPPPIVLGARLGTSRPPPRARIEEEEEPTERNLETAPTADPFEPSASEETTERDLDPTGSAAEPSPGSRLRDRMPDSEPGTSPDLRIPFERGDSAPPSDEPARLLESDTPPTSQRPRRKRDLTLPAWARKKSSAPPASDEPPSSRPPASRAPDSALESSEPPASSVPESEERAVPLGKASATTPRSEPRASEAPEVLVGATFESSMPEASSAPLITASVSESSLPPDTESAPPPSSQSARRLVTAEALPSEAVVVAQKPPAGPAKLGAIEISTVPGLEDLPEESQFELVSSAALHELATDEEVTGFALALVLEGAVSVMPEIADVTTARAQRGEIVFSQGHLDESVAVRVVAARSGAKVAAWTASAFATAVSGCPWVGDELKNVGDRLQTLAGIAMGPMGEQLDDMLRALVVEHCQVRRLLPGELLVEAGKPVPGMIVVGAGKLEIVSSGEPPAVTEELAPGSFLFASGILQASPAPASACAGKGGALLLFAERKVAHELLMSVPPLLGIFAQ